jgi:hypothetical protein
MFPAPKNTAIVLNPFGSIMVSVSKGEYRYGFNTQEKVDEIAGSGNHYTAEFWEYDSRLGRRWNPDPKSDPWESVYVAFANNPIYHTDVAGDTEDERKKAVEKAKEYKEENPGGTYQLGAKGQPGEKVDCSGLVSNCVKAAGLPDPNNGNASKGTTNIKNNTTQFTDINQLQEGNGIFIDFSGNGGTGHTGIISSVTKDKDGNVTAYSFIHSGSSNGPTENSVTVGKESYYSSRVSGFYKWDTPDKPAISNGDSKNVQAKAEVKMMTIMLGGQSYQVPQPQQQFFKQAPPRQMSDYFKESRAPIVRDLGEILDYFGF